VNPDFGFWIADFGLEQTVQARARLNPKSKIQNPK
jgi:hypothetical protein